MSEESVCACVCERERERVSERKCVYEEGQNAEDLRLSKWSFTVLRRDVAKRTCACRKSLAKQTAKPRAAWKSAKPTSPTAAMQSIPMFSSSFSSLSTRFLVVVVVYVQHLMQQQQNFRGEQRPCIVVEKQRRENQRPTEREREKGREGENSNFHLRYLPDNR